MKKMRVDRVEKVDAHAPRRPSLVDDQQRNPKFDWDDVVAHSGRVILRELASTHPCTPRQTLMRKGQWAKFVQAAAHPEAFCREPPLFLCRRGAHAHHAMPASQRSAQCRMAEPCQMSFHCFRMQVGTILHRVSHLCPAGSLTCSCRRTPYGAYVMRVSSSIAWLLDAKS